MVIQSENQIDVSRFKLRAEQTEYLADFGLMMYLYDDCHLARLYSIILLISYYMNDQC